MDDLIQEFVAETTESLSLLDQAMVKFEREPNNAETLSQIFRVMHTIKGTCGFLGLARLEKVAHAGEDVLGKFRDGELQVTGEAVTLILQCLDTIRGIVGHLADAGAEPEGDDSAIIIQLRDMAAGRAPARAKAVAPAVVETPSPSGPAVADGGFPVAAELEAEFAAIEKEMAASNVVKADFKAAKASVAVEAKPVETKAAPVATDAKKPAETIRVGVDVLENLMALVSEMVLTRNQLLQIVRSNEDNPFKAPIQRLNRVTTDLQESVMKTRMQPIGNAWNELPRIVRDLANELGKQIDLIMSGEDTELDRQVLEMIRDPLTHMVRNSADHGLEQPADRRKAGKPETGAIHLSARHEGGHIIIEVADDGRGLNTERIRNKIVEKGLATAAEVAAMDDNMVNQFIMKPGFSTAEKVTNVSGRGVGMDVVRSNIEKIGGTIEFVSAFGRGSTFTIKIPLTLAIVSALIVEAAGQRFAIPQISVRELVRASGSGAARIEMISGAPVLRLRDRLLPLIGLGRELEIGNDLATQVVVCRSGAQLFGIVVDRIADAEEIVVKPLSRLLGGPTVFSGNTVLGDGNVILILDTNALGSRLNVDTSKLSELEANTRDDRNTAENILLFRAKGEGLMAVPLSAVHRIETFAGSAVEWSDGKPVVQYRNELLPLLAVDGAGPLKTDGTLRVLVFIDSNGGSAVGLVIEKLEDIVTESVQIARPSKTAGLLGSQIIAGRSADYIDPPYFINRGRPVQPATVKFGEAA